jgi:lysozyme family protein
MECGQIYRRDFASKIGFDTLPPGVDILAFDIAVNMGPGRALDFLSQTAKVTPNPARILELHKLRMGFWKRLAIWTRFGKGWAARETACLALALRLANA